MELLRVLDHVDDEAVSLLMGIKCIFNLSLIRWLMSRAVNRLIEQRRYRDPC